jgi:hypothetical protein
LKVFEGEARCYGVSVWTVEMRQEREDGAVGPEGVVIRLNHIMEPHPRRIPGETEWSERVKVHQSFIDD